MGEALWWTLDSRLRDPQAPPLDVFESLVTRELQLVAYNRPQHAEDFRIACSCATVPHTPQKPFSQSVIYGRRIVNHVL